MAHLNGKIVELLEKNELERGFVTKHVQSKIHYVTVHGRQKKASEKQVVHVYARPSDEKTFVSVSERLDAEIGESETGVDLELLWEAAREEIRDYGVPELAAMLLGESDDVGASSLLRCLLRDTLFFKRHHVTFTPREPEQVEELRRAVLVREERKRIARA